MLKTRSVSVVYGSKTVIQEISLDVIPGSILALIGPNGAGKTTLIRAISGTVPLRAGKIFVEEKDLSNYSTSQRAKVIAVVPQARQLGGAYTVEQAVMMGRTAYMSWLGRENETDQHAVHLALQNTNLEAFSQRPIAQLSGGEQQRVLLARALAQSTPVLLMDEPTNQLDLQHQTNLLMLIKKFAVEKQLAVLMAMHDLNLVSFFADKVALLVDGRLIRLGAPKDVIQSDIIGKAYQIPVEIVSHPITGAPITFPKLIFDQYD